MGNSRSKQECYLSLIIEESGTSRKLPLNVCLIGTSGVGKSSFINTIAAALNGIRWREHATVSDHGRMRKRVSYIQRFEKCCQEDNITLMQVSLPTLIDVPGFQQDEVDRVSTEEILRLIFYGKIWHKDSLQEAKNYCKTHGIKKLQQKYGRTNGVEMFKKTDRIIFVASASQKIPKDLIQCVVNAAQPSESIQDKFKRSIPIFGVLTHASRMERELPQDLDKIAKRFRDALGIKSNRLLKCSNYCDDFIGERCITPVQPELDIPVLEFLVQVFDRSHSVLHDHEMYNDGNHSCLGIRSFLVIVAIIALLFYFFV